MTETGHFPAEAAYDRRLADGSFRSLVRLFALAWDGSPEHPVGETAPLDPVETAEIFGISRSTFYAHLGDLRAIGWLSYRSVSAGRLVVSLETSPGVRTLGPSSSWNHSEEEESSLGGGEEEESGNPDARTLAFHLLSNARIGDPLRKEIVDDRDVSIDWIRAHIGYARARKDPTRFLAQRLRRRDPKPDFCPTCLGADGHKLDCPIERRKYVAELEPVEEEESDGE